jgi:hypothetical protein
MQSEMREMVLDVASHSARHVFFSHHSETHKSPSFGSNQTDPISKFRDHHPNQ